MNGFATPGEAAENAMLRIKLAVFVEALSLEQLSQYVAKVDCPEGLRHVLEDEMKRRRKCTA